MCRLLVVDDEPDVRRAMTLLTETWGYTVMAAADVAEAVMPVTTRRQPDVLVVDYRLRQNETGVMVVNAVSEACGSTIPAIIVTGDTDPQQIKAIKAHGYPLFHKPIHADRLRQAIADLCRRPVTGMPGRT